MFIEKFYEITKNQKNDQKKRIEKIQFIFIKILTQIS